VQAALGGAAGRQKRHRGSQIQLAARIH
jgi:hypothetical protein